MGGAKSGQFDKIYYDESTGKLIIIEAKGGGSELGGRNVTVDKDGKGLNKEEIGSYQQGTKEYMESVIWNYKKTYLELKNKPNKTPEEKAIFDNLEDTIDAFNSNKLTIEYYEVRQKIKDDGSLGNVKVTEFDLGL